MISILTPTFNRSHTLQRLYDSLRSQDCKRFEWIVIDDGSSDNTKELINKFISENNININYHQQENKGKPSAINAGVPLCQFEHVFIVDSDDALTSDAVSSLINAIEQAEKESTPYTGVGFRKAYFNEVIMGAEPDFKNPLLYLNATEAGALFKADLAYCFKKESLLSHPFPFYKGEKFFPELYIWNKITDEAKIRFDANKIIYLADFLEDGLTKNFKKQLKKYPHSFSIYYKDQFCREKQVIKKIKMLIRYLQCKFYESSK